MSWAHELLGIDGDADERAIKRAYAAKLRTTRPDEDPEGFQRLNEAYQAALEVLRHRLAQEAFAAQENNTDSEPEASTEPVALDAGAAHAPPEDVDHNDSAPVAQEAVETDAADDAEPQGEAITLDQFLDACLGAAGESDPRVLENWLRSQPVLWSLEHKAMIGHWLLRLMDARQPPMTERNFDMLAEFFGYNDLHAGYDPLALQRLRARLIEAWRELQRWRRPVGDEVPATAYSLASIAQSFPADEQAPPQWTHRNEQLEQTRQEQAWQHRLMRKFAHLVEKPNRLRDLRLLMAPWHATSVHSFLMSNPFGGLDNLPADIRRDQVAFWLSVANDRRWQRRRAFVALLRSTVIALSTLPIALLLQTVDSPEGAPQPLDALWIPLQVFAILMACWLGIASFKSWLYWQTDHAPSTALQRITQYASVPSLVTASMAGMFVGSPSMLTFAFGTLAGWTSLFQFRARLFEQRHGIPLRASDLFIVLLLGLTLLHAIFYFGNSSNAENSLWATLTWVLSLVMWAVGTLGERRA